MDLIILILEKRCNSRKLIRGQTSRYSVNHDLFDVGDSARALITFTHDVNIRFRYPIAAY